MHDKPVKQQSAADYLGEGKPIIRDLIACHGVLRHGAGEGKVKVSDCFAAIVAVSRTPVTCPTCGTVHDGGGDA